jgi:tetratricopeptide (TPR) repeat protein
LPEPNILLDALIDESGLSHAGFAARVNEHGRTRGTDLHYDHASVARWVRDHAVPRGEVPELICEILSSRLGRVVTLSAAGLDRVDTGSVDVSLAQVVDSASARWRNDMKRADAGQPRSVLTGPAAIAPVFEWENPPDDLDVSSRTGRRLVTAADVALIGQARGRYEEMYRRVGGVPVRPRVVGFLDVKVAPLLRESYDDEIGRQLMRAAAGVTAIAGICLYDTDRQAAAQRYFFDALRLAKASGDRGFGGYIVALLANQAMYLGRFRQVIQYAETALRGARSCLSPALVSDLCTLQAKAYARMGHRAECHGQMRKAEQMAGRIRVGEEPPETGYVQPGMAELQHAEALRQLHDLVPAQRYAEEAISISEACHLRSQMHRFATLAMILADRGQAEEGAHAAEQMLDRARGMESGRVRERVLAVSEAIRAQGDSIAVRDFAERVAEQFSVPL